MEKSPENHEAQSEKEARSLSALHRKLATPWLCLLAVLAPAPFCMRFRDNSPLFWCMQLAFLA